MSKSVHEFSVTRFEKPSSVPDGLLAKEYARSSRLNPMWTTYRKAYGFRDLQTGEIVMSPSRGVSSYRALYVAMLKYVATKRKVS